MPGKSFPWLILFLPCRPLPQIPKQNLQRPAGGGSGGTYHGRPVKANPPNRLRPAPNRPDANVPVSETKKEILWRLAGSNIASSKLHYSDRAPDSVAKRRGDNKPFADIFQQSPREVAYLFRSSGHKLRVLGLHIWLVRGNDFRALRMFLSPVAVGSFSPRVKRPKRMDRLLRGGVWSLRTTLRLMNLGLSLGLGCPWLRCFDRDKTYK